MSHDKHEKASVAASYVSLMYWIIGYASRCVSYRPQSWDAHPYLTYKWTSSAQLSSLYSCPELKHKIHCYQSFYFIRKCWFPTEYKKTFWNCIWNCRVTFFFTLKTGVMMQKFQLYITGINYTLKCIQIWKLLFQIVLMFDIKRPFSVSLRICYKMNMN